jgi:P-type Ca2+ transporter type 2C
VTEIQFSTLNYKDTGLNQQIVNQLINTYGQNIVVGKKPPSDLYFLFKQFQNPLIFVLIIAILITVLMGDFSDAFVIALAVIVNTTLGFIQERKAFKSLESLKKVVNHKAFVLRDGKRQEIDVAKIVPGDIVVVYEGDKIPADGLIIENNDLLIEEAILTGESMPVEKNTFSFSTQINTLNELISHYSQHNNKIESQFKTFMGTVVVSGSGKIMITQTGMRTQFGTIAAHLEEHQQTKTPLEIKLDNLARLITIIIIILCILIFIIGILTNRDPMEMFTTAVAIAVAAIPEGLVVGLTAILAIGMNRILKRNGLVRSLVAAETLGSVTTVCVDKTGTLTEGKMKVNQFKTNNEILLYTASTLANDRKDPIEIARLHWATSFANKHKKLLAPEQLINKYQRHASIPFSVERRFLAVQIKNEIFLSGAPEEMLNRSTASKKEKEEYVNTINKWASEGKRLIGFGYIQTKDTQVASQIFKTLKTDSEKNKIQWLGLMSFNDPIRKTVIDTIKKTQSAGINIKIITGDFASTAVSVMKQLGMPVTENQVMEGSEVESLTMKQLQKKLSEVIVFARTKPSQKLKIVNALQNNGEVVGMMGDGVNDAPALATADIGIVVENASEIAKESSELILLDSNMNTIIAAIEEGRAMFENLRK